MSRSRYETAAGLPTKGLLIAQILERIRYLQEDCAMYAHLLNTEDDGLSRTLARGWLGMVELLKRMEHQFIQLGKNKLN
jgi:hypothetical protein